MSETDTTRQKWLVCNLLISSGLISLAAGIFLRYGLAITLSVIGIIVFALGITGALRS